MKITKYNKNKIKERLYFTYLFYNEGFDLNKEFEIIVLKKYKEFMNDKNIEDYTNPNLEVVKFELKNRLLLMTLSLLCEMFEQFLGDILISNNKNNSGLEFSDIKKIFKNSGYDLENNSHWNKINELRLLVNVIKHGDGRSRRELQGIRDDFFVHEQSIKNTLNDVELNVWDDNLVEYFLELIKFIDEIPNEI